MLTPITDQKAYEAALYRIYELLEMDVYADTSEYLELAGTCILVNNYEAIYGRVQSPRVWKLYQKIKKLTDSDEKQVMMIAIGLIFCFHEDAVPFEFMKTVGLVPGWMDEGMRN
jgi:hypothetical protein